MKNRIENPQDLSLEFYPVTRERWTDLEKLFGENGACGGCWCMWWRLKKKDFDAQKGAGNRIALKDIVMSGREPGIQKSISYLIRLSFQYVPSLLIQEVFLRCTPGKKSSWLSFSSSFQPAA